MDFGWYSIRGSGSDTKKTRLDIAKVLYDPVAFIYHRYLS